MDKVKYEQNYKMNVYDVGVYWVVACMRLMYAFFCIVYISYAQKELNKKHLCFNFDLNKYCVVLLCRLKHY